MRRLIWILVILVVLGVGGWYGYQQYTARLAAAAAAQSSFESVPVERGSIASTVSATGSIEPEAEISLSFRTPGRIDQVLVNSGDTVVSGQLLAKLDTADLELARDQAEVGLEIAQAQLARLTTPPKETDIAALQAAVDVAVASVASAQAALASAQASYRQLLAAKSESDLAVLQSQMLQAEAQVRQAQSAYNQVRNMPNVGALPQSAQLEQATIAYEAARAQYESSTQPADQAQIAAALSQIAQTETGVRQARSGVVSAQNNLQTLLDGPDEQDIRISQAQVRQAELSLRQAQNSLANAQLLAPNDGVISLVNVRQGELYSGGLPAMRLTNLESFHMTVLVDEIDVRQVQEGQTVRLVLDALPESDLTGQVVRVSPTANDVGGVVAYEVEIVPDTTAALLRAGMSATALITTAQVENVLLAPNRYIQPDRENGTFFVYRVLNGQPVLQEVQIGLRNDRFSQIIAGLNDGDSVALISVSSEDQLRNALFGGGN